MKPTTIARVSVTDPALQRWVEQVTAMLNQVVRGQLAEFLPQPPASVDKPGVAGQMAVDSTHLWICKGSSWVKVALV
jgi:hypothetical protein